MKNYFQKILSLFARHNYSEQTNQMFYRWLVDNEYEKEKDEALQELYLEARKKGIHKFFAAREDANSLRGMEDIEVIWIAYKMFWTIFMERINKDAA